jgi:hypothetical protein
LQEFFSPCRKNSNCCCFKRSGGYSNTTKCNHNICYFLIKFDVHDLWAFIKLLFSKLDKFNIRKDPITGSGIAANPGFNYTVIDIIPFLLSITSTILMIYSLFNEKKYILFNDTNANIYWLYLMPIKLNFRCDLAASWTLFPYVELKLRISNFHIFIIV